jgi:hypothetical protein
MKIEKFTGDGLATAVAKYPLSATTRNMDVTYTESH